MVDSIQRSKFLPEDKTDALVQKLMKLCSCHERYTLERQVIVANRAKNLNTRIHYNMDTQIAYSAFSGCSALKKITIPGNVTQIADDAFVGCSGLTIFAPAGSAGHALAEANAASSFSWQPL